MLAKISSRLRAFCNDDFDPSRMRVVSSAYWLILHSTPSTFMPRIDCSFLIAEPSTSAHKINKYGESGHPCLTPRLSGKNSDDHPLF